MNKKALFETPTKAIKYLTSTINVELTLGG